MSEQLSPGSKRWQQLAQVFFLLLLSATPLCSWAKDEDLIPKIPIPVLHSYKPSEGPIFESWATERGLSRREIPQPENFATGSGAPLTWKPIPDQPQESPANARTTLRTRLRNHKKENAPPGRWMHSVVVYEAQIFTFGGVVNAQTLLNDVWGYDYSQEAWHELEPPSNPLLHHPLNSETEMDRLRRKEHFHPPGSPPQPTFRLTPANARSKVSSFRRQNLAKLHGDEMQVVSVPSVVVQPPLAVEPIALGARHAHFDLGAKSFLQVDQEPQVQGDARELPYLRTPLEEAEHRDHSARNRDDGELKMGKHFGLNGDGKLHGLSFLEVQEHVMAHAAGTLKAPRDDPLLSEFLAATANSLWTYHLGARIWSEIVPATNKLAPLGRWLHTAVVPTSETSTSPAMYVFGGVSQQLKLLNDVWKLDLKSYVWTDVTPTCTSPTMCPEAREGHAATVTSYNSFDISGGMTSAYTPLDDIWTFSTSTKRWTQKAGSVNDKTTPTSCSNRHPCIPEARWMHTMTAIPCNYDKNSLSSCPLSTKVGTVIYGGCSAEFAPLDDVWLHTSSLGWFPVSPIPSMKRGRPTGMPKPHPPVGTVDPFYDYIVAPARWLHTAAVVPTSNRKYVMLVHGGAANNVVLDDVWIFPASDCLAALQKISKATRSNPDEYQPDQLLGNCSWIEDVPVGKFPIAREGHAAVVISHPKVCTLTPATGSAA
eukprot:INCI3124.2.p1 GENE.INCI3124.2~~INCI3124.2.p1  ORF type:complete len:709 (+),score=63.97 INCI3124.2:285-2411(+)